MDDEHAASSIEKTKDDVLAAMEKNCVEELAAMKKDK